jgi:hypothetical protein
MAYRARLSALRMAVAAFAKLSPWRNAGVQWFDASFVSPRAKVASIVI